VEQTTMRGAFGTAFVTLAGLIVGSLAQAQTSDASAICPGINGAKLPTKVTYDDGSVLIVVDRSDGKVHQQVMMANGRKFDVVDYQGLFVLTSDVPTGKEPDQTAKLEQTWNQDLTQFFPLKAGERILADASTRTSVNDDVMKSITEMTVWSVETVHIGECDYPVFKIDVRNQFSGGGPQVASTRYYHQASMLTLRRVSTTIPATPNAASKVVERRAVKIE
jgi:hypothetical protein